MIIQPDAVDWDRPGATHVRLSFGLDGSWGSSLVPLTVINPSRSPTPPEPNSTPPEPNSTPPEPNSTPPEPVEGRTVAIFGGTHGNEYESQVALTRLCADLDPDQLTGRVIIMPRLSEDACRHGTRAAVEDGVNMNRAFPGDPNGTLSYRIAHFVSSLIIPQAQVILDLHAGGQESARTPCAPRCIRCRIRRGSTRRWNWRRCSRPRTSSSIHGSWPPDCSPTTPRTRASSPSAANSAAAEPVSPTGVAHVYQGVINVLRRQGILPGEPEPILGRQPGANRIVRADDLRDYVPAPGAGLWEPVSAARQRRPVRAAAGTPVRCRSSPGQVQTDPRPP